MTSQYLLSEACIALGENLASLASFTTGLNQQQSKQARDLLQSSLASVASVGSATNNNATSVNEKDATKITLRRDALNAFADAATYASRAQNYAYVVHSARHFWNLSLAYLQQAQERAALLDNLKEILTSWQTVYKFKPINPSDSTESDGINKHDKVELLSNHKKIYI